MELENYLEQSFKFISSIIKEEKNDLVYIAKSFLLRKKGI